MGRDPDLPRGDLTLLQQVKIQTIYLLHNLTQFLFLSVPICSYLFLSVHVCSCLFLSVLVCPCAFLIFLYDSSESPDRPPFMSVPVCSCLFLSVPFCCFLFLSVHACSFLFLSVLVCFCLFLTVLVCPCAFLIFLYDCSESPDRPPGWQCAVPGGPTTNQTGSDTASHTVPKGEIQPKRSVPINFLVDSFICYQDELFL